MQMPIFSELAIRRYIPSLSRLTYNPLFRRFVNFGDSLLSLIFPAYRWLPPNHLRIRVGVGNRLFNNQPLYLSAARNFWILAFAKYKINLQACIVDLGCGCGRYAHHLRDFSAAGEEFTGEYIGVDIDEEQLDWCRRNFDERFRFHLSSDTSTSYKASSPSSAPFLIPEPDGIADLVFSASLFTHLLEACMANYLRETYRLLKPGGVGYHSVFLRDAPPSSIGTRHSFQHVIGNSFVESLRQPEAAVAYHSSYLVSVAKAAGFSQVQLIARELQSVLVLIK